MGGGSPVRYVNLTSIVGEAVNRVGENGVPRGDARTCDRDFEVPLA